MSSSGRIAAVFTAALAIAGVSAGLFVFAGVQGTSTASASVRLVQPLASSAQELTGHRSIRVILPSMYELPPIENARPAASSGVQPAPLITGSLSWEEPAPLIQKGDFLGRSL